MKKKLTLRSRLLCATLALSVTGSSTLVLLTSCEGLDYSAQAEGTGVQIIGAIVVLAKYHASPQQKAVAEQKAREAVAQYVKPVYTEKRAARQTTSRKKIVAMTESFDKRIAAAKAKAKSTGAGKSQPAVASSSKPKADPKIPSQPEPKVVKPSGPSAEERAAQAAAVAEAARLEKEKADALAKLKAEAAAELNALDSAWRSLGGVADHSVADAGGSGPVETIPAASTRDKEALVASATAHVPNYIAVSVPAQGIAAESGGKSTVMLWDTRRQQLASNDVLVLDRKPDEGKKLKVDGLTAQFVGNF